MSTVARRAQSVPALRVAAMQLTSLALRAGVMPYRPAAYVGEPWGESDVSDLDYIGDIGEVFRYSLLLGYITYFGGRPHILDVGCGKGHLRQRMAGTEFGLYVGVDPSPVAIDAARRLADDRTSFVVGDVAAVDITGFDVVVSNEVLYYLPDPERFLDRVRAGLPPKGLLLTSMWRHGVDDYLWRLVDDRFERLDMVEVRNPASRIARRGWRVACHRRA